MVAGRVQTLPAAVGNVIWGMVIHLDVQPSTLRWGRSVDAEISVEAS